MTAKYVPDLSDIQPGTKGLTFGIITYNEEDYIERCVSAIRACKKYKDAPIVVIDGGSIDSTVTKLKKLKTTNYSFNFIGHYANQKNMLMLNCKTSWMFNVDADEILTIELLDKLDSLINNNEGYDAYKFSRKNIIDGEDTNVYPDYQTRLYRTYCRYIYPVHEELVGYTKLGTCDIDIIHDKKEDRHNARNGMYGLIEEKYNHELKYMKDEEDED